MCVAYLAHRMPAAEVPAADREAAMTRDSAQLLYDTQQANVLLYSPGGDVPPSEQWWEPYRDLLTLPWEVLWWLRYAVKPVVMTYGVPVTDWPTYQPLKGGMLDTASGIGWPTPAFNIDLCYPVTPTGVARGGTSVVLHEIGHTIDWLGNGAAGVTSVPPVSAQEPFVGVHRAARWPSPLYQQNRTEAFAEGFALWNLARRGDPHHQHVLPAVDRLILDYWDDFARRAGWRSVTRATAVKSAGGRPTSSWAEFVPTESEAAEVRAAWEKLSGS